MKVLPGGEIRRPAADVGQALRFREVCLLPPQLLRKQLLLGDVHGRAKKSSKDFLARPWTSPSRSCLRRSCGGSKHTSRKRKAWPTSAAGRRISPPGKTFIYRTKRIAYTASIHAKVLLDSNAFGPLSIHRTSRS